MKTHLIAAVLALCFSCSVAFAGKEIVLDGPKAKGIEVAKFRINKELFERNDKSFATLRSKPRPKYVFNAEVMSQLDRVFFVFQKDAAVTLGEKGSDAFKILATYDLIDCVGIAVWNPKLKTTALAHIDTKTDLKSLELILGPFAEDREHTEITLVTSFRTMLLWKVNEWLKEKGFTVSYFDSNPIYMSISADGKSMSRIFHPNQFGAQDEDEIQDIQMDEFESRIRIQMSAPYGLAINTETGELYKVPDLENHKWSGVLKEIDCEILRKSGSGIRDRREEIAKTVQESRAIRPLYAPTEFSNFVKANPRVAWMNPATGEVQEEDRMQYYAKVVKQFLGSQLSSEKEKQ